MADYTSSLQLYELQVDSFGPDKKMSIHQPKSATESTMLPAPLSVRDENTSVLESDGGNNPPPSYDESVATFDSNQTNLGSVNSSAPLLRQRSSNNSRRTSSQADHRRTSSNRSAASSNRTSRNQQSSTTPQSTRTADVRGVANTAISLRVQPIKNGVIITGEPVRHNKKQAEEPPVNDSKRLITAKDKEILATHVGDYWRKLGRLIGVPQGTIDNIKVQHDRDQRTMIVDMLDSWYQKFGHKATINYVIQGLLHLELYSSVRALPYDEQKC